MEQQDVLGLVAEFHNTFNHPILPKPQIPDVGRCKLRVDLIREELKELEDAISQKDIVEIADALCDIQYVLSGAVLEFGMGAKFIDLFNEVHRSNMSKCCETEEEAKVAVEDYLKKNGTECYYAENNNKWLIYRRSDNKTLKSKNYSPANLKIILESDL